MKALIVLLAAAVSFSTAHAQTDLQKVAKDVAKIKSDLGSQTELAGAYYIDSNGKPALATGDDYLNAVAGSYLYADFNKDGIQDLAVVFEDAPSSLGNGVVTMGNRSLQVFLGDQKGYYDQAVSNSQLVLAADEGGALGDPFNGLQLTSTNSIKVFHSGGSGLKWALTQIYQYRGKDFYWIGDTRTDYNSGTRVGKTTDINLITGDEVITNMKADGTDQTIKKKLPVKPLVRMAVANPNN